MPNTLQTTWLFILIPTATIIVGGIWAAYRPPGPRLESSIQHFAAGMVFAAVAGELLPEIQHQGRLVLIVGFALGTVVMLGMKWLTEEVWGVRVGQSAGGGAASMSLLATVAVDLVIDGLLLGISLSLGTEQGLPLMIAISAEDMFLGLAAAVALVESGTSRGKVIAAESGLAVLFAAAAIAGLTVFGGLPQSVLAAVVAFAAAALLYLVTEELLVEAHEAVHPNPLTASLFFAGFLALLLVEMTA